MDGRIAGYRVFRTAWFTKAARKARIPDTELCFAIGQVVAGQADDLGGGVFKKRLDKNRYRSIIVTRAREFWIFEYLFAKKDRANIEDNELKDFRKLSKLYNGLTAAQINRLLEEGDWKEICHD